ncbi:MAG: acyl-CoA oxidase, partial [Acidobacteria bacterium]
LTLLCDLFALERLEHHRAFFLEQGYFEPAKAKAIRKQVKKLCTELRPHAEPLVNAFAIPKEVLAAPIAE